MKSYRFILILAVLFLLGGTVPVLYAQWGPDVRFTYNDSSSWTSTNYRTRCISSATGGSLHVVWFDERDGNREIYYKRSRDEGASWSPDIRLTSDSSYSDEPSVFALDSVVHVVWSDARGGYTQIFYKRSTDIGMTWSPDLRLPVSPRYSWGPSVVAVGPFVHAVWVDGRDLNDEIYYKRSTDQGMSWSQDYRLTADSGYSAYPSVSASGSTVHLTWVDDRDGNEEIYYKRSTDLGLTWSQDTRLTFNPSLSFIPSIVAVDSNVYIVWADLRDGSGYFEIYFKQSMDWGVTWSPDRRLTYDSANSISPSVVVSGSDVHVVWEDNRDGRGGMNDEIYYKVSTDKGLTWSQDTRLTYDSAWSGNPSMALTGTMIHVVWTDERNGYPPNTEIYYKRNPPGNTGVEEGNLLGLKPFDPFLTILPSPFSSFATVPGHLKDNFALYDITGSKVGIFKGDRIGLGLAAGVYFMREEGKEGKPMKVVKVK